MTSLYCDIFTCYEYKEHGIAACITQHCKNPAIFLGKKKELKNG
jgi:hypothetical protein